MLKIVKIKTLPGASETWTHVVAMHNPRKMFFFNCVSKTMVLFCNEIWLREKTQTFCYCFHNYSLGKAGLYKARFCVSVCVCVFENVF